MAQRIVHVSDLSSTELDANARPLTWGWRGKTLEIDLTDTEIATFEKAITKYLEVSRSVTATSATKAPARRPGEQVTGTPLDELRGVGRRDELLEIRGWCKANGMDVNERGRLPIDAIRAYYEAHQG